VPGCPPVVEAGTHRLPVFGFPEQAARALGQVARHAEWRRRPAGVVPMLSGVELATARRVVTEFLTDHPDGGRLPAAASGEIARALGIPFAEVVEVTGPAQAITRAHELGLPVVLKTGSPQIVHKTDVGGVQLDLDNDMAIAGGYWSVAEAAGDSRVLVQAMAPAGVEMLVGMVRDPAFGPVVMVGTGGVLTDLLADRTWRGLPLTDHDATDMLAELRGAKLLAGYRGAPAADADALLAVIHRVALLAETFPEIAELDLNPVIVSPSGATAVDVRIRLTQAHPTVDPYLPRLS
jgi:hypothetical protein